jgi:transcriptional regulator with XRE-family HTH domain
MESISIRRRVSFAVLQARLIHLINLRVANGDFTERGLARILGISQSQVHNLLKGVRRLKPELADHVMRKFEMSILDLLEPSELRDSARSQRPALTGHCGEPGTHVLLAKLDDLSKDTNSARAKVDARVP